MASRTLSPATECELGEEVSAIDTERLPNFFE